MPRHHKDWIHAYVDKMAPRSEAPRRYLYWSAVAAVGGALRRRCYIDMVTFKWHPNWFIILVGPPGLVKKSTTIDVAMGLLRKVPGVNFGSDINTWEGFIDEIEYAKDAFAVGDISENIMEQNYEMTSAITLSISEWGMFLDPKNLTMINVLTDLWDCKDTALTKNTKTQGRNVVTAPYLNMVAGTTPKWMGDNFRFVGWGFSARCIFLHCDKAERSIAFPDQLWGDEAGTWRDSFIEDLCDISTLQGPMELAPDARAFASEWYQANQERITAFSQHPNADPWVAEYLARKQTHIMKLCICLSAARRTSRLITLSDMREATDECNRIEDELTKVFGSKRNVSRIAELNQDVWNGLYNGIVKSGGEITYRQGMRFCFGFMSRGEAVALIDQLIEMQYLSKHVDPTPGNTVTVLRLGAHFQNGEKQDA
jgi:hypothetical protein